MAVGAFGEQLIIFCFTVTDVGDDRQKHGGFVQFFRGSRAAYAARILQAGV